MVGLGAVPLLLAGNLVRDRLISSDLDALRAVEEIETRIAIAHLWIEELVTGDAVESGAIDHGLERARELAEIATRESRERAGTPEARASWKVIAAVDGFARLTASRRRGFEAGEEVGVGSAVDVEYDRAFARLRAEIEELELHLVARLDDSKARVNRMFGVFLGAWVLGVLLAAGGLWTRERRQRRAEAALRESEARFLESQKREAIGRLAGGVAHDINNYLAAITAQCELVKMRSESGGETARRMDAVLSTAGGASSLIERLLAFSRRQPVRPEAIDINEVIRHLETMLRRLLGADIRLEIRLEPALWPVKMDRSQAEQILLNLAVNARDAMPTGGVLRVESENGVDRVLLRVSDEGEGVAPDLEASIFEPFFTTKQATHSGLGLSTVLGIVEQNGGSIRLVEGKGRGAVFEVALPRTGDVPARPVKAAEASAPPAGAGRRVLLVEDNEELRRSTRDLLLAWGFRVSEAGEGGRALEVFAAAPERFDLVLTDVVMPGKSGPEVVAEMRLEVPDLTVLFTSGHSDDVVLRHGVAAGEVHFLKKPFDASQLAEGVREALG